MKIVHIMSDGTERESIDGFVVPYNEITESFYEIITREDQRRRNEQAS